ncbi:MAG: DUF1501 domain-containing protein [Planctomyces sp.]|nr:DUF1501 domain-containing protein [Planctomyces sp.]
MFDEPKSLAVQARTRFASLPNRRRVFDFATSGLLSAAILDLLGKHNTVTGDEQQSLSTVGSTRTHFPPSARRVIHICLIGGFSQVDTFDYKPELERLHGKSIPGQAQPNTFFGSAGLLAKPYWTFRQRGQSGLWMSDLFPHLAEVADQLTIIRSMVADTANHTPAYLQQMTGFQANGFPSMGSWISYGLGNETDSLPTFVVLPDARSLPNGGASNWASGFLPAEHQGVLLRGGSEPIRDLFPRQRISPETELASSNLLAQLNGIHLADRKENDLLKARVQAFELAARMQISIPESVDFRNETQQTLGLYGIGAEPTNDCGQRCLLARRLLERGVRYVQLFSGGCFGGSPRHGWDSHEDCFKDHEREAAMIDKPIAGLLSDLQQRGMLDDTLVLFTTEFGRTPFANAPAGTMGLGRDHNPEGFSVWMAGGGTRSGTAYGETDEIGWKSVENKVTWPDLHATVLHLLGLNHKSLTFYHNGIQRRLTNVHGNVVQQLITK